MAYSPTVVRGFRRALRRKNASPKVGKALFEAGITESGLQNLAYGDRDSQGPLQQRASQGWVHARNPYLAALDFIAQAQPLAGKYGNAGQLAQAVQRSAYPARYGQHAGEAQALLRGSGGGGLPALARSPAGAAGAPDRTQLALSLIGFGNLAGGGAYGSQDPLTLALLQASRGRQAPKAGRGPSSSYGGQKPTAKGVATFEGKPVAAWIRPWLVKARQAGWKGTVTSGFRSLADQTRIYNSGVRPAAKPGTSNHEFTAFPGGAIDVTDAQTLSQILTRLGAPLKWAGAKDPVHFSHPHGGSY